jgi:hypothetical protein
MKEHLLKELTVNLSKAVLCLFVFGATTSVFAMSGEQDYSTSIYGKKAERLFNLLPKMKSACAYKQADSEKQGDLGPKVSAIVNDSNINSVLCMRIGESTFACEASTLWFSEPCKLK